MADWNAQQYEKFEQERLLPARDLANAIQKADAQSILDVRCGTGNSTKALFDAFPNAHIIGADNSDDMLATARKKYPEFEFRKFDVATGLGGIGQKFDIVFSNACLQWIPNHAELLPRLMELLNDGGVLAVQVPIQSKHPMHAIMKKVALSSKWTEKIAGALAFNLLSESEYFDILSDISSDFRLWETDYLHAMPSHQSIIEWYKGTGMRPYLEQLSDADKAVFEADVLSETEKAYPIQKNGEIIFRFPRLFFVAEK